MHSRCSTVSEKERLRSDPAHLNIEVSEKESRELEARLINDMTVLGR